jgi:S-layer protein
MAANGGWIAYPDYAPKAIFARASDRETKTSVIKQGQVLKALSFLQSDASGKLIAHSGFNEGAVVSFAAITSGQTVILAGLTFTSGASGTTAAQLATAWATAATGDTAAAATTKIAAAGITAAMGTFTAGTLTGFETELYAATKVIFNAAAAAGTNPTDLAATGTATAPGIAIVQGSTTPAKIAGVLVYDVDATSADVPAAVYVEASFWADALVWAVDTAVDTITNASGAVVACTAYNTGAFGTSDASNLLKSKFVEGSEFDPLTFAKAGEVY